MEINKQPRISLLLFTYNHEKFIEKAIQGAFSQTYEPLEIILSDDCSTDSTFSIMKKMCSEYQGPHTIILNKNKKNLGVGEHVNKVSQMASGDWLVMAAGDDVSNSNRCSIIVDAITHYSGAVAIITGMDEIDAKGDPIPFKIKPFLLNERFDPLGDWDWIRKFKNNEAIGTPGCSAAWHRSLFALFPPLNKDVIAEDALLGLRAYLTGGVLYLPDIIVHYRVHGNNLSASNNLDIEGKIKKTQSFEFRMLPTYEQCISDTYTAKRSIPNDKFIELISYLTFQLELTRIKSVWWNMSWLKKLRKVIWLFLQPYKINIYYWISILLPLSFYLRIHKSLAFLRK